MTSRTSPSRSGFPTCSVSTAIRSPGFTSIESSPPGWMVAPGTAGDNRVDAPRSGVGHSRAVGHPTYWRSADPKASYDVVIVGGGGHGLSTAYYLASRHGVTDVCVVEKGWLAGGNMARNTTIIRSNYLWDESAAVYEHSLKLWEGLEDELGFDVEFSQRGVLNLAHDLGEVRSSMRRVNANRLNGVDADWLTPEQVSEFCPLVNISPSLRYPVMGATLQRRGGVARHDKVAWAYATRASELGVDIVEHAEVTGFVRGPGGRVQGVETTRGTIGARAVALAA